MHVKQKYCPECGRKADHYPDALHNTPPEPDDVPQPAPQHFLQQGVPVLRSTVDEPETESEPSSHGSQLPDGWAELLDEESGESYYHNYLTDVTQWERPHDEDFRLHPERRKKKPVPKDQEVKEETTEDDQAEYEWK